jgi:acetoin utilization deacetylase AcuC-like enzyme
MLILHDPQCAGYRGASFLPEKPERVIATEAHLRAARPGWTWRTPGIAPEEIILLAHSPEHLRRLDEPRDFDPDTPWFPGISGHARRSVGAAVEAARHAVETGRPAFSLMRPPGHHASADTAGGFCYLNQVAVAALAARRDLGTLKVAVWDFDAHHGNGTEAILGGRDGFLYCSVHQHPAFPGTGSSSSASCLNWPVRPGRPRAQHMESLRASWEAVLSFKPGLILISAGFDAYAKDPITDMTLEIEDFAELGRWVGGSGVPTAAVLEGGYSDDLPQLIGAFLAAWAQLI